MEQKLLQSPEAIVAAQHDDTALERLLPEAHDLVYYVYWRYFGGDKRLQHTYLEREDLYQEGMEGFLRAVKRYDPSRGTMFTTFAVPYILGQMRSRMRGDAMPFHMSRGVMEKFGEIVGAQEVLRDRLGREPTAQEVQDETGLSQQDIVDVFKCHLIKSLHEVVDSRDPDSLTVEEIAADKTFWEDEVYENVDLDLVLFRMKPQMAKVIRLRLEGLTQWEIARRIGRSQAQVSRLLDTARREWQKLEGRDVNGR